MIFYPLTRQLKHPWTGVVENTGVADYMARIMGLDLKDANKRLFVNAEPAFKQKGVTTKLIDTGNNNLVLVLPRAKQSWNYL